MREEILEEAELIVQEGGEIPEVAFWNAYFYLTSPPPQGLGLILKREELRYLKEAVVRRYLRIIERDLTPENIDRSFYRRPERARINWLRLRSFLEKEGFEEKGYREKVRQMAEDFWREVSREDLRKEARDLLDLLES